LPVLLFFSSNASALEKINDPAPGWDRLWHEVLVDITVLGIVFAAVTFYFLFKYRRKDPNQVGQSPKLTSAMAVGWALIPGFAFMADDFFLAANGWKLWNDYRRVPEQRMEIKLESGMYSWDYTYPNGAKTQNEIRVPAGMPVMLRMTSRDTIHSHFIPDYRVKEDSMPGRVTYLWFYPKNAGSEHVITCAEYCGVMHSYMVGKVVVLSQSEFDQWYEQEGAKVAKQKAAEKDKVVVDKVSDKLIGGV
jgi:cytochrome c oxidase subunit 2